MILETEAVKQPVVGVAVSRRPENLSILKTPGCAAALWHRQPEAGFQTWIDALDPQHLPDGRVVLHRGSVHRALNELCDIAGTPQCGEREQLIEDATALSVIFADLMDAQYLRVRLQAVTTNACRKFHIDAITARLVCTYRGTGTQLGMQDQNNEPQCLLTVPTGAPIVLRGTKWPEYPRSGLLHRSPPIEGTGETRLVVVIDPVIDPDMEI